LIVEIFVLNKKYNKMNRSAFSKKIRQFKHLARKISSSQASTKWLKKFRRLGKELSFIFGKKQLLRWAATAAFLLPFQLSSAQIAFDSTAVTNPFNLQHFITSNTNMKGQCSMDFVDIDNDGDLDIFVGSGYNNGGPTYVPRLWFIQNTGTPTAPYFNSTQVAGFNLYPLGVYDYAVSPHFTDMDQDGDYDLLLTGWYGPGNVYYYQNTGTASNPSFASVSTNPFGMNINLTAGAFAKVTSGDIDADGDLDLFAGNLYNGGASIYYQLNTSTSATPSFGNTSSSPFGLSLPNSFTAAQELVDIDKDGDLDVFTQARYGSGGVYSNGLRFNPNQGTPQSPSFSSSQQLNAFGIQQVQGLLAPAFGDLDNDGDEDLMFIDFYGTFYYYENQSTYPMFEFDSSSFHTTENMGTLAFTLWQRQASNVGSVSVQVFDSGMGSATAGIDYILNSSTTFNFPLGFSYQTVNVQILDDALLEGQETIILQLTSPSAGTSLGTNSTTTIYINDDETTSNEHLEHAVSVEVFPNPVVDQLQIKFAERGRHYVKLFDMSGKQLISKSFNQQQSMLDLHDLPTSVYQLEIYNKEGQVVHRQLIVKD
jgi:hypothetical protein